MLYLTCRGRDEQLLEIMPVYPRATSQSTTEYVLIVTAVAIAAIVAYAALGTDVSQLVNNVSTSL